MGKPTAHISLFFCFYMDCPSFWEKQYSLRLVSCCLIIIGDRAQHIIKQGDQRDDHRQDSRRKQAYPNNQAYLGPFVLFLRPGVGHFDPAVWIFLMAKRAAGLRDNMRPSALGAINRDHAGVIPHAQIDNHRDDTQQPAQDRPYYAIAVHLGLPVIIYRQRHTDLKPDEKDDTDNPEKKDLKKMKEDIHNQSLPF